DRAGRDFGSATSWRACGRWAPPARVRSSNARWPIRALGERPTGPRRRQVWISSCISDRPPPRWWRGRSKARRWCSAIARSPSSTPKARRACGDGARGVHRERSHGDPHLSAREHRIELRVDAHGEALLIDPLWTDVAPMSEPRKHHAAARLDDGGVLVMGGNAGFTTLASAELYDPLANAWTPVPAMSGPRNNPTATLLDTGHVLVAGGNDTTALDVVELFDPLA